MAPARGVQMAATQMSLVSADRFRRIPGRTGSPAVVAICPLPDTGANRLLRFEQVGGRSRANGPIAASHKRTAAPGKAIWTFLGPRGNDQ